MRFVRGQSEPPEMNGNTLSGSTADLPAWFSASRMLRLISQFGLATRPPGPMLRLGQRSSPARSAWVRCGSTTQAQPTISPESTSSPPPPSDDKKASLSRPGNWKTRRPHINPQKPRQWNRPLAPGVLPAFDEALRYIRQDSHALRAEAQYNRSALRAAESSPDPDPELIKGLKEKLAILEVQSEVNCPEIRWNFRNGLGMYP